MEPIKLHFVSLHVLCCLFLCLAGCSGLPQEVNRRPSFAINPDQETALGRMFAGQAGDHPGQSGVRLLGGGLDAFVARAHLAEMAEQSIDVQYYMFNQDTVGRLLIHFLLEAADRGVRVRMLIDDIYGSEADDVWTALASHPNMAVRLFNPFVRGPFSSLQWITRFRDVNYRMHSKSFTVDNQASIVGGRNIGDEYFNANPELAFADLDLLAVGSVVPAVSEAFDQYWNSEDAFPASALTRPASTEQLAELKAEIQGQLQRDGALRYIEALKNSDLSKAIRSGSVRLEWAPAKVAYDSPEKRARGENWRSELLISQLMPTIEKVIDELILVSPYFVPGQKGTDTLCSLSERGVKVRILTNSLASNDVAAVHAGYSGYRKQLLKAGVVLYELDEQIKKTVEKKFTWLPGLSKSSLHAKTMVLDRKAMFVGSMNLDARSLNINNEIGILFQDPGIAGESARSFDRSIEKAAFRLKLDTDENGGESIRWHLKKGGEEIVYDSEPYVGFWQKVRVGLIRLLPVESLL